MRFAVTAMAYAAVMVQAWTYMDIHGHVCGQAAWCAEEVK